MTSRRPVNRVTSTRRPLAGQSARRGSARNAPAGPSRKPRVAGVSRPTAAAAPARAGKRREREAGPSRWRRVRSGAQDRGPREKTGKPRWGVVAVMVLAAMVLGAFSWFAAQRPGVDTSNRAFVDNELTQEVRSAADHALRTIFAYDANDVDGYRDAIGQVITGKMLAEADKFTPTTASAVAQGKVVVDADAEVAVTLLTDDRAELLANVTQSATRDGSAQPSVSASVVLHMQKVDGRWLVSELAL
ncbi:hypothetical protein ACL02S_19975 [Nocardia sp. 004]|uniref:hypothetical protein n=1 Tax=Nocardia sp. 004 TaxID=3385978 RepID=UPI0039A2A588